MNEKDTLKSHIINEAIQYFFHDRFLLYFNGNVTATYLSIENNIRHSKLAVNDVNKIMWENFFSESASDLFSQYFSTWKYNVMCILIIPTIKSATAKLTTT